jgi:hypothetical protein
MKVVNILVVLAREENHDVLVAASIGDACRDEWPVGVVVRPQNWVLSDVVEEAEESKGRR